MLEKNNLLKVFQRLLLTFIIILVVSIAVFYVWIQDLYVVPIMVYHNISMSKSDDLNVVNPKSFVQQMEFLKNYGYQVISLDDYIEGKKAHKKYSHKTVVITFDDGYKDNFIHAFPVLRKNHFPATIFLISDYTGVDSKLLTWDQVIEMDKNGITFGSHTRHHVYLPDQTEEQIKDEINGSKRVIEEHLSKPIYYLAYPSGGFSEKIKLITSLGGYKAALTTNRGNDQYNFDLYELNRIHINNRDNWLILSFKLSGYYNFFRSLKPAN